jgi:hypothetical protein
MKPVTTFSMPHNFRDEIYAKGEGPSFCHYYGPGEARRPPPLGQEWATLPIAMPESLMTFTDPSGRVIAAWADGNQIRWADIDVVVKGVRQYNLDCARQGIGHEQHVQADDELPDADC